MRVRAPPASRRRADAPQKARAVNLRERVEIAERGQHQASLCTVDRDVMRQAVSFPGASVAFQLSHACTRTAGDNRVQTATGIPLTEYRLDVVSALGAADQYLR